MADSDEETENAAVVIDNGSGFIKAGFATLDFDDDIVVPKLRFPSIIEEKKSCGISHSFTAIKYNGSCYDSTQKMEEYVNKPNPIQRGVITNWDEMEHLWNNTYEKLEAIPDESPILLTESALTPKANREKMTQIMFETFKAPQFYVSIDSVLALYASGRTTGIVLSAGDGITNIVPIYEGYYLPHSVNRLELAGKDINEYLDRSLPGYHDNSFSRKTWKRMQVKMKRIENGNYIKEKLCYICNNYNDEIVDEEEIKLPDGQCMKIGWQKCAAPEILFQPKKLMCIDSDGIDKLLFKSIMECDVDIRKILYNNILLTGGSTMFDGLSERIKTEIIKMAPQSMDIKVIAPPERENSVWIGGCIISSLSTFEEMWITKEQYDESGPSIVHRKCT